MNERIRKIWYEAAKIAAAYPQDNSWETQVNFMEQFASLIVKETITEMSRQLYWHGEDQSNNPSFYKAIDKTKKHFGVEE